MTSVSHVKTLFAILNQSDGDLFRMTADALGRLYRSRREPAVIDGFVSLIQADDWGDAARGFVANVLVGLGEEGVQAILDLLGHGDDGAKDIAIDACKHARDTRVAEQLVALLAQEDYTYQAGEALVAVGPVAVPALLHRLKEEEDWSIRCSVVGTLADIGVRVPEVTPTLLEMLAQARSVIANTGSSDRETIEVDGLANIIDAMGAVGDVSAVPILRNLFQDLRWGRYHESILLALGQLKSPVTLELVRDVLAEPTFLDEWARSKVRWLHLDHDATAPRSFRWDFEYTAMTALGQTGDAQAISLVRSVFDRVAVDEEIRRGWKDAEDAPEPAAGEYTLAQRAELQTRCALSLAELGAPDALEALLRCLYCSGIILDKDTVDEGFPLIGRTAVPGLIAVLNEVPDAAARVRTNAADSLARVPDEQAVPVLVAQLGYIFPRRDLTDSQEESLAGIAQGKVRGSVALALGAIGDSRATEPLLALLKEYENHRFESFVRPECIEALGKIKDPRAAHVLAQHLYRSGNRRPEKVGKYNEGAVTALRSLGPAAFPAVRALLEHEEATWRCAAVMALGQFGDQDSASALQTMAETDPDPTVRDAAQVASVYLETYRDIR